MVNEYILRAKKFHTKKRLGQNFLISKDVINEILSFANSDDTVLEIGPGAGFVTEKLVEKVKKVVAVELDEDAVNLLDKNLSGFQNFKLIKNDILKTDLKELFADEIKENKKIKVIANIPYYITTPILLYLLGEMDDRDYEYRNMIDEIILMVQYEVAKRITANHSSKNKEYGLLSILSNFWAETSLVKKVSKRCFYPSPKVDSALVRFKIQNNPKTEITPYLKQTVRAAFSMRRKNIKNCLKASGFINVEEALSSTGIDYNLRGENLSIEDFYKLSLILKREEQCKLK